MNGGPEKPKKPLTRDELEKQAEESEWSYHRPFLLNFYTKRQEIGEQNPDLDEPFDLDTFASVSLRFDTEAELYADEKLKPSDEELLADYREIMMHTISRLVDLEVLREVGERKYQLTEYGKSKLIPPEKKH